MTGKVVTISKLSMIRSLAVLCLALAVAIVACTGSKGDPSTEDTGAASRSFAMGLSSLPSELTEDSYGSAFDLAESAGEVILIQRTPPWQEMLSGGVSEKTAGTIQREKELAKQHNLDLFFAIDPIDATERGSELAGLPADLRGSGFANEDVRRAFVAYAQYIALNYKPRYLALGVEVNSYERQNPDDFARFVSLYAEAYDAVKERSPDTLVFPTFQLEELNGRLPDGRTQQPQWHLIDEFEPKMDLLALSTYPGRVFSDPAQIPSDYYLEAAAHTDHPVAIAEMGYTAGPDAEGNQGPAELRQAAFLDHVLGDAERLNMPLVVWFVGQDPKFTGDPSVSNLVQYLGLLRADGSEKAAWSVWSDAVRRPLRTPSAQRP